MNNKKSFKKLLKILLVQITLLIGLSSIITAFANPVVNITGSETAEPVPEPVEIEENTEAIEQEKLKDVKDEIMQGEQPSDGEQVTQEETVQVQETTDTPEIAVQAATDASNFNFDASTGTITSLNQNCTLSDIVIPKQIGGVDVTAIGDNAFSGFTTITTISFEDGNKVTEIGNNTFKNMKSLSSIVLPTGVTSIGTNAFENTGISSIVIPNGVTSIPDSCFSNASNLTSVTLGDKVTSIGTSAFASTGISSIDIPNGVTSIPDDCFWDASNLTSVTLGDKVTSIGDHAFYSTALTDIKLPNTLKTIGAFAIFSPKLSTITIPSSVNTISSYAFDSDMGMFNIYLKKIYIPSKTAGSISDAPWGAFSAVVIWKDTIIVKDSSNNDKYAYESSTKTITKYLGSTSNDIIDIKKDFQNSGLNYEVEIIGESAFQEKTNISSVKIPDTVTQIKSGAFSGCGSATLESLPAQLTEIGSYAFEKCGMITSIKIPDTVTEMDSDAFSNCSSLKSIEIGTGLTSLESEVFEGCSSLEDITIPNNIKEISYSAFYRCSKLKFIRIPNYTKNQISGGPWGASNALVIWKGTLLVPENNPKYVYDYDEKSGKGTITKYIGTDAEANIEQDFKSLGKPVTEIGDYAFKDNMTLKKVVVPSSVTKLGSYAFSGCSRLESIKIPDTVTEMGSDAFSNCSSLKSIEIGKGLSYLKDSVFYGCSSLEDITIPNNIKEISYSAFYRCSKLKFIRIPNYTKNQISGGPWGASNALVIWKGTLLVPDNNPKYVYDYDEESGKGTITKYIGTDEEANIEQDFKSLGKPVTEIDDYAFAENKTLKKVVVPSSVTKLGNHAFYESTLLESVSLPDSLTEISDYCFTECFKLINVNIPGNLKRIGHDAFASCRLIQSIELPETVNYMGSEVFRSCSSLKNVKLPRSLTDIPAKTFEGCNQLKKVEIPDTVTRIGSEAFQNCDNLMEVKLPNNLNDIEYYAFSHCSKLTSIDFPDKLDLISYCAFSGTSLAGTITLPTSVTYIDSRAFSNVTTLNKLIIPYARVKCPYVDQHPYGLNENNPTQIVYGGGVPNIKARVTPTKDSTGKKKYLLDFDIDFRDKDGNIYDAITRINLPDETGELSGNIIHVGQRESWSTADNNKTLDVTQRAVYKIQIAGLDNELHDYEILLGKIELENNEAEFYLGDMKTLTMNQILYRLGIIDKDGHTLIKDEFGVSVDCTYNISDEQMNAIHNMKYGDKLETKIGIHDPLLQKDYDITINVVSNAIKGKVIWDDNDNRKGLRPSSVNVNLYSKKANSSDAEKLVTTKAITEGADGAWSFGFEEASPWENKNVGGVVGTFHCGDELKYTISPTIPAYYSMEIKENPSNFFTITLTVDQIPVTGLVEGSNGKVLIGLSIGLLILSSAYFVIKKHRKIIKK